MRLSSITVERYRSITTAKKIPLGDKTVLVGPNNEGKSNIIRALVLGIESIARIARFGVLSLARVRPYRNGDGYDWHRDFPFHLREKANGPKSSAIVLEYVLDDTEIQEFRSLTGTALRGTLPIRLTLGNGKAEFRVVLPGPATKSLSKRDREICRFVDSRLSVRHIPAVRTARSAEQVVSEMVSSALESLYDQHDFKAALAALNRAQEPLLQELSTQIQSTLNLFVPQVARVEVALSESDHSRALAHSVNITIDDGTPTLLKHKGDGVQSLVALALLRHQTERMSKGKSLVLAIEEPESHLHPTAIHELRRVLDQLSTKQQVVLTTHNPVFTDRIRVSSNIVVNSRRAAPAQRIDDIRTILGVRASDNLRHAELVLVVEGDSDVAILDCLFRQRSELLEKALRGGATTFLSLKGSSNLKYQLALLDSSLCLYHCILDHDEAGRRAAADAESAALLSTSDRNFLTAKGKSESELEDWIAPPAYKDAIRSHFGVDLSTREFRGKAKWSQRMQASFLAQSQQWNDKSAIEAKTIVAECVMSAPGASVLPIQADQLDALIRRVEDRVRDILRSRGLPAP